MRLVDLFMGEVGHLRAIDEGLDVGALGDDAEVIPLAILHEAVLVDGRVLRRRLRGEPAEAGGFAVDVAGLAGRGFDLALGSVDATGLVVFAFTHVCLADEGADLDAGVQAVVVLDVELEFKVAVFFVRAEKGVGAAFGVFTDNGAVLNAVGGDATLDAPAVEVRSVEEVDPAVFGGLDVEREKCRGGDEMAKGQ